MKNEVLDNLYKKKKLISDNIILYKKSKLPGSTDKIKTLETSLLKINIVIDSMQKKINNSIEALDKIDIIPSDTENIKKLIEKNLASDIDEEIAKSKSKFREAKIKNINDKKNNIIDDTLSGINSKYNTRNQTKEAIKKEKEGPNSIKRSFIRFKNSSLYKFKPKTRYAMETYISSLEDEKSFWENRIVIIKHKLLVFGNRKNAIDNAKKNIADIDQKIQFNKKLLIKKEDSFLSKIKNITYKLSGAESAEEQDKNNTVIKNSHIKLDKLDKLKQNMTEDETGNEPNENEKLEEESANIIEANKASELTNKEPDSLINDETESENKLLSSSLSIKRSNKKERKKSGIQTVSTIMNDREKDTIKVSNIIISQNDKIIKLLSQIQADDIDEQDTSMKVSQKTPIVPMEPLQKVSEQNVKKPNNFLNSLLETLGLLFGSDVLHFFNKLKGSSLLKFLWSLLKGGGNVIKFLAKHIWSFIKGPKLLKYFNSIIGDKFSKLIGPLKKGFQSSLESLKTFSKLIGDKFSAFVSKFEKPLSWLSNKLSSLEKIFGFSNIKNKALALKDKAISKVSDIKNIVENKALSIKNKVISKVSDIKDNALKIKDKAISKVSLFKDYIKNKALSLKDKALSLKDKAISKVSNIKNIVKNKALALKDKAIKYSSKALKVLKKGIGKTVKFGKGVVTKIKGKALALAESKVLPMIGKILGKKSLKILLSTLKVIPGVSIVTGLGFGIKEAIKGHYKKAALEVIAGLVGSIPAVGPALGLAVSLGGSMVIDKYNSNKHKLPINKHISNKNTLPPKLSKLNDILKKEKLNKELTKSQKEKAYRIYKTENHIKNSVKLSKKQMDTAIQNYISTDKNTHIINSSEVKNKLTVVKMGNTVISNKNDNKSSFSTENTHISNRNDNKSSIITKNDNKSSISVDNSTINNKSADKNNLIVNKTLKIIEKSNILETIANNKIQIDQIMYRIASQNITGSNTQRNINNIQVNNKKEDINVSEVFPHSYH